MFEVQFVFDWVCDHVSSSSSDSKQHVYHKQMHFASGASSADLTVSVILRLNDTLCFYICASRTADSGCDADQPMSSSCKIPPPVWDVKLLALEKSWSTGASVVKSSGEAPGYRSTPAQLAIQLGGSTPIDGNI